MKYKPETRLAAVKAVQTKPIAQVAKEMSLTYATVHYWNTVFVVKDGRLVRRDKVKVSQEATTRDHLLAAREVIIEKLAHIDAVLEMFAE